ncbi:Spy/CpxP family protein refolding chaperone [Leptothoe kymatousa]|uniref:Spy/CpxP family protein refolding chaperone n=1 Tax=Leptothoe kymatousa TAU-MAC 1615 TaxID=2364775 RepID=A0ABS5Y1B1_9CYAN|nr:Spy/CpxP family protein refolding chaperone [Leptothoe kymatousa]MBT9311580.1 Spy/CpxP family protein refolding chaperone [Leptothoe kymatousa TAU-MAC 1615]
MNFPTIKQCVSGVLMLTAVLGTTAIFKAHRAHALPGQMVEALNLTAQQQTELDAIKENARTQINTVLTADQQAEVGDVEGRELKRAMRQLDLSQEQRTQLRSIREDSRAAMNEVLTDEQQTQLQAMKAERHGQRHSRRAEALNLTTEQQAELDAIKENARTQAEAVLTAEQRTAVADKTGREWMRAMRGLDLSEDQRTQLQEIRQTAHTAAEGVLTAEQQAQMQEMRSQRRGQRR